MGLDKILLNGDMATFDPKFGAATVAVRPDPILGHGPAMVKGKLICVEGDEKTVVVAGCTYITANHTIPGVGIITIKKLNANQLAKKAKTGGKKIMLLGGDYEAEFTVLAPAIDPKSPPVVPPQPDLPPGKKYNGKGRFVASNVTHKAT